MSYYRPSGEHAISDFRTYYLGTSEILYDLYVKGLCCFYENDIQIKFTIDPETSVVTAKLSDVENYERNISLLTENNFCESLDIRTRNVSRSAIRFEKVINEKRYDLFHSCFSEYYNNMVLLMATANFYPNFVDDKDSKISDWLSAFEDNVAAELTSQPSICPFLKLVDFGLLKVQSGLWDKHAFVRKRMFLYQIDVIDYFCIPNQVNQYFTGRTIDTLSAKRELVDGLKTEIERIKGVNTLRSESLMHHPSELAQLLFTSIDAEEIRHYWQTRFIFDASRLAMLVGLPLCDATLDNLSATLKEI
jgi:hypothetical protein